jgi:hypothetical protein
MKAVRAVTVDLALLQAVGVGDTFTLTPEVGLTVTAKVRRVEHTTQGVIVGGTIDGALGSFFNIVTFEDATAMTVGLPSIRKVYRLHFMGGGAFQVCTVDESLAEPCGGGLNAPISLPKPLDPNEDDIAEEWAPGVDDDVQAVVEGGCSQSTPVFDTWVLYTPAARDAMGGTTAIRAEAVLAVENANTAYGNSVVSGRARLIRATEISYTESGSMNTDLDRLTNNSDGFIDSVHTTRDSINADLVIMYTDQGSGLAWCIADHDSSFGVVKWSRAAATLSHAHETGHNIGLAHDRANADCGPAYNYGYGYTWVGDDNVTYSTVMSYGAGRIAQFSNPNVDIAGQPSGVPSSSPVSAYNAAVINNRDTTVANFELTRWDIYVDSVNGNIINPGTYSAPYLLFSQGAAAAADPGVGSVDLPNLYLRNFQNFTGTVSRPMTIRPCGGSVTVGN